MIGIIWSIGTIGGNKKGDKRGDIEHLREILTRMMVETKVKEAKGEISEAIGKTIEEVGKSLDPVHVWDFIRHVSKEFPSFGDVCDYLREVSHPNAARLIKAYVRNDWNKRIAYFGKERGGFGSHLESDLRALIVSLEYFMDLYDESALLFEKLIRLCEMKI